MKKIFPLLVLCIMVLSCKKDDDNQTIKGKQSDLTGVWTLTSVRFKGIELDMDICRKKETITVDSSGNAIWKDPGLISQPCNIKDKHLKFVALNTNFNIEYQSETISFHGKFLKSGMIEIISIFKVDAVETKSVHVFAKK